MDVKPIKPLNLTCRPERGGKVSSQPITPAHLKAIRPTELVIIDLLRSWNQRDHQEEASLKENPPRSEMLISETVGISSSDIGERSGEAIQDG